MDYEKYSLYDDISYMAVTEDSNMPDYIYYNGIRYLMYVTHSSNKSYYYEDDEDDEDNTDYAKGYDYDDLDDEED